MTFIRTLAALATICLLGPVHAAPRNPAVDTDYILVPAVKGQERVAGEVIEFFSYGCGHCHTFEQPLSAWVARHPGVKFRRIHVSFGRPDDPYQRLYYTLEAMGQAEALTPKVFDAVHSHRQRLSQPENLASFVKAAGLDHAAFMDAYRSPGVDKRMADASRIEKQMGVQGTPVLVINRRYLTGPGFFVESHRSEPGAKAPGSLLASSSTTNERRSTPRGGPPFCCLLGRDQ